MSCNRKIVFFDIDGTIIDEETGIIPTSTKDAIKKLNENGHIPIVNTGRTLTIIPDSIKDLGFKGYILGCGTTIILEEEELLHTDLGEDYSNSIIDDFMKYKLDGLGEGKHFDYFPSEESVKHPMAKEILTHIGKVDYSLLPLIKDSNVNLQKFVVFCNEDSNFQEFYNKHKEKVDFIKRGEDFYEVVPFGYSKATGIEFLINHLNIPHENTFAIGDSPNDISMFKYAKHAIAMGNSSKDIFPYTNYTTSNLLEDGIYNALKHFELI